MSELIVFLKDNESLLQRKVDIASHQQVGPFNMFLLISNTFYKENFHSDIIAAFLNYYSEEENGYPYFKIFIDLLNKGRDTKLVDLNNYQKIEVQREKERRDITILGNQRHAILIENKLNDAVDMDNQIPRYYKQLVQNDLIVDAIVYLTLNQSKEPDRTTWDEPKELINEIDKRLVPLRAYTGLSDDLLTGWIKPCIDISGHGEAGVLLNQYSRLITKLTSNHMDLQLMNDFGEYLKKRPELNSRTSLVLRDIIDNYPIYINQKVINHFKRTNNYSPFASLGGYYFNGFHINDQIYFSADLSISHHLWSIDLSIRGPIEYQQVYTKETLKLIGLEDEFTWNGSGRYVSIHIGDFASFEDEIIKYCTNFLKLLDENKEAIKAKVWNLYEMERSKNEQIEIVS